MAILDELTAGAHISGGPVGEKPARLIQITPLDDSAMAAVRHADGSFEELMLYPEDIASLIVVSSVDGRDYSGDATLFRLALEAHRIRLAHFFDPYLALRNSSVEPLPHQIAAVYQEMLPRLPLRFVLADDPGAGKTIMTGLYVKELMLRSAIKRCLIVCPGGLAEQWQQELQDKFGLRFEILSNDRIATSQSGNPFNDTPLLIARLDKLARSETELIPKLQTASRWDLVVCDEAHKMSVSINGRKRSPTKRFRLGEILAARTEHLLLLTATPHNGKEAEFQAFMSLVDRDRFGIQSDPRDVKPVDVSDVMRRLSKEELMRFDGTPLFPPRYASTLQYSLDPDERALYQHVTQYVREEFSRADTFADNRRNSVGFALTILQRRLASSPEAIHKSLMRRRERLQERLETTKAGVHGRIRGFEDSALLRNAAVGDEDEFSVLDLEYEEEVVMQGATASRTIAELQAEIETLCTLEAEACALRQRGSDHKWQALCELLQDDNVLRDPDGTPAKLIIFTEHKDTIRYLHERIAAVFGRWNAVVEIHGGLSRAERKQIEAEFRNNPDARVLLATDAAGEGINLQFAHLMVNYDLPWNPNRLEQRFGRIHRIGQRHACYLWNLVSVETREGQVFELLLDKLEQERASLPGQVFDVIGKLRFDGKSLRDILEEAVRSGSSEDVARRILPAINSALDPGKLMDLFRERALTDDAMDPALVSEIKEDMERMEAQRLQPHFISSFVHDAVPKLGGRISPRESGRYEVGRVPPSIIQAEESSSRPAASKYERICFEPEKIEQQGKPDAELVAPGHALLEGLIDGIERKGAASLQKGTILVDTNDTGDKPRLLVAVEDTVRAGSTPNVSLGFLEVFGDGSIVDAGPAPHLDYTAPDGAEMEVIREFLAENAWSAADAEEGARRYAARHLTKQHLETVQKSTVDRANKTWGAVEKRLSDEIRIIRARIIKTKGSGKSGAEGLIAQDQLRIADLQDRLERRKIELDEAKKVRAGVPNIFARAVVIPRGLLDRLMFRPSLLSEDQASRDEIERIGMDTVCAIERALGYTPRDVSAGKIGWDIESSIPGDMRGPDDPMLRFIEVKGRAAGSRTVHVTRNEILRALTNPEQFILAVVEVGESEIVTTYMKRPFEHMLDVSASSAEFDLSRLKANSEIILERKMDKTFIRH